MRSFSGHLLLACAMLAASFVAGSATDIETRMVQFASGASSATLKGSIKGSQTIDYKLVAKAGQTMNVKFTTSNASNYFNVLPPGSADVAIFVGANDGNAWTGVLPADGAYTIRVYLYRNAARRNETAQYTLTAGITGSRSTDAKVSGTSYHAVGKVPCSMGNAPRGSAQCDFGVIRGKPGRAEVHVTPPGGFKRVLKFDGSQVSSDAGTKVYAHEDGDTWLVDVNDFEHYRIPEAVITGG